MADRKSRLARAIAIGDKLWRLQQMRVSAAERELATLRAAEADALATLGRAEPSLLLAHIASLGTKRIEAERTLFDAQERARVYGRRLKLTEKLHKAAADAARNPDVDALLDHYATRRDVSAG
jgi:hypothetical protein